MKSNEELLKEFEKRRNFTIEEYRDFIQNNLITESENNQILEVDDLYEYMHSLGYSTLDEIKEKYNI